MELEAFWAEILSREPGRILVAWETLTQGEQRVVRDHLRRMVAEDGWMEPQRLSAEAALVVLRDRGAGV